MRTVYACLFVLTACLLSAPAWAQTSEVVPGRGAVAGEVPANSRLAGGVSVDRNPIPAYHPSQPDALDDEASPPDARSPEPIAPFFTLSAPAACALTIGGAPAMTTITASGVAGFTSEIALIINGLPSGLKASLSPSPVSPGSPPTLQIAALADATAGNYTFTVRGVGGNQSYSVIASVTVSAPPSFRLTASPSVGNVHAGSSSTLRITPALAGNFTGTIKLQVSGLPPYSTATYQQQPGSASVAMNIATTTLTPPGRYSIVIAGAAPDASGSGILKTSVSSVLNVTSSIGGPAFAESGGRKPPNTAAGCIHPKPFNILASGLHVDSSYGCKGASLQAQSQSPACGLTRSST